MMWFFYVYNLLTRLMVYISLIYNEWQMKDFGEKLKIVRKFLYNFVLGFAYNTICDTTVEEGETSSIYHE